MTAPDVEPYTLDAQDPNDPVWESDANMEILFDDIPAKLEGYGEEPDLSFRNKDNVLTFVHDVVDEIESYAYDTAGPPLRKTKLETVSTKEYGSDMFRGRKASVTASAGPAVLTESLNRRRIVVYNVGPNIAYIGGLTLVADSPNGFAIPVSGATVFAPITLQTRDNVYAICKAGETATLYFIEEFDLEC